jgi:hypothetical protein
VNTSSHHPPYIEQSPQVSPSPMSHPDLPTSSNSDLRRVGVLVLVTVPQGHIVTFPGRPSWSPPSFADAPRAHTGRAASAARSRRTVAVHAVIPSGPAGFVAGCVWPRSAAVLPRVRLAGGQAGSSRREHRPTRTTGKHTRTCAARRRSHTPLPKAVCAAAITLTASFVRSTRSAISEGAAPSPVGLDASVKQTPNVWTVEEYVPRPRVHVRSAAIGSSMMGAIGDRCCGLDYGRGPLRDQAGPLCRGGACRSLRGDDRRRRHGVRWRARRGAARPRLTSIRRAPAQRPPPRRSTSLCSPVLLPGRVGPNE